jgi:hypothetical protein
VAEPAARPIEDYGKTTALRLIEQLAYEPNRSGGTTVASIYHQLEHRPGITLSEWSGARLASQANVPSASGRG